MPTPATLRPIQATDWSTVREVTLMMLAEAPYAYGETLAEAEGRPTPEWGKWTAHHADTARSCAFLAEDDLGLCGFVRGDTTFALIPPDAALVGQLWVAPRQRGTGLARRLMAAVTEWAQTLGKAQIVLGITEGNMRAVPFYEHLGYHDTGMRVPLVGHEEQKILVMARALG